MRTVALINALKGALKGRGITYAALAARLGLSEGRARRAIWAAGAPRFALGLP